jgi:hypothetical protein
VFVAARSAADGAATSSSSERRRKLDEARKRRLGSPRGRAERRPVATFRIQGAGEDVRGGASTESGSIASAESVRFVLTSSFAAAGANARWTRALSRSSFGPGTLSASAPAVGSEEAWSRVRAPSSSLLWPQYPRFGAGAGPALFSGVGRPSNVCGG